MNTNILETKGCNLEHNFGHGDRHPANLLLTMNLLAFLFHTGLEIFDPRYSVLRKALGRRDTFFDDIHAIIGYICFDRWEEICRLPPSSIQSEPELRLLQLYKRYP